MLPPHESGEDSGGRCRERSLSLLHQLPSATSLSSLRRASIPNGPYTLLTLPSEWAARILSYLSPDEKLVEVCHVSSALHRSVLSLSSAFKGDFLSFASSSLPPLLAASPWFRGVSGVSVRGSGPDPFHLDKHADEDVEADGRTEQQCQKESGDCVVREESPVPSGREAFSLASSRALSGPSSAQPSPFSSIRSLSIALSLDCSPSAASSPPRTMLSSLSRWSNLRHLHITADDTEDWLTAANFNCGLLTAQNLQPFLLLTHLRSLTLDATVRAEQVLVLAGMDCLQSLLLTEREQRAGVDEQSWQSEEEQMMSALSVVSRLVRNGRGLTQLRMPHFHNFSVSADDFCERLSELRLDASASPMSSLCVQGALSSRGMVALCGLTQLTSLTLGWGCELDADEQALTALPQCRDLQHLHVRLSYPHEQDEHDEKAYLPALPHVLSVSSLTSLSLHLPVSGWSVHHSCALSTLCHLRRLTIAGEASGISSRHPLGYDKLLPLVTTTADGKRPLPKLRSLTLDWLPLTNDAMLIIAQLTELTSLSLLNCPYLSSFLFSVLTALPALVLLRVNRCDVHLTAKGWRDAEDVTRYLQRTLLGCPVPFEQQSAGFPRLQVLECHLVHRLSCDVDDAGFSRLLSLLPPRHLHTFDFDSDYYSSSLLAQLSAFPHLRSLGSLSSDISPLDTELILAAKCSMGRVLAYYYDRQYTRIERGERSRWRSRRRSTTTPTSLAATDQHSSEFWLRSREAEVEDDEEQRVLHDEGDEEIDVDDYDVAHGKDREERWCTQARGVQFRHQQARQAFFERLAAIDKAEQQQQVSMREQVLKAAAGCIDCAVATETDGEEEDSGVGQADEEADQSPRDEEAQDDGSEKESWECEQQDEDGPAGEGNEWSEQEDEAGYGEWEWSQQSSSSTSSSSPSSLSVSLVGRSSKLQSRRYKRDEKMAVRLKASLPHTVDKKVKRDSSGGGVRLAGVVGQRKWEYAAALR